MLSISWGSAEQFWSDAAHGAVQAALAEARDAGVTVVAAAGDELATAGVTGDADRQAHVVFPGSSPLVLCCGGTSATLSPGNVRIVSEAVWNEGRIGTGGGISDVFPVPDYQAALTLPVSINDGRRRRGVPDVAAMAGGDPGYRIVLNAERKAKDGTSAATPFWAALVLLAVAARGRRIGLIQPFLYANPDFFRPITTGNNRIDGVGYDAGPGWNACCGFGAPLGDRIIAYFASMA